MEYAKVCKLIDSLYADGDRGDSLFGAIRQLVMYRLNDEDAAQDVCISALTRIDTYKGLGPFHAFINRMVTDRRCTLIAQATEDRKIGEPGVEVPFNAARFSPDFGAIDNPFVRRVAELIGQGYKQMEIAGMLGLPLNTLKKRLHDYRKTARGTPRRCRGIDRSQKSGVTHKHWRSPACSMAKHPSSAAIQNRFRFSLFGDAYKRRPSTQRGLAHGIFLALVGDNEMKRRR